MLLVCYRLATAVLLVVVFAEAAVLKRQRKNLVQFVIHHTGIVVGIQIAVALPLPNFLYECACLEILQIRKLRGKERSVVNADQCQFYFSVYLSLRISFAVYKRDAVALTQLRCYTLL